jgi:hypothetical protein
MALSSFRSFPGIGSIVEEERTAKTRVLYIEEVADMKLISTNFDHFQAYLRA